MKPQMDKFPLMGCILMKTPLQSEPWRFGLDGLFFVGSSIYASFRVLFLFLSFELNRREYSHNVSHPMAIKAITDFCTKEKIRFIWKGSNRSDEHQ